VVRGRSNPALQPRLVGFEVIASGENTTYVGWVADQAAFEGVLAQVEWSGAELILARRVEAS
jgi:hypothetical protein